MLLLIGKDLFQIAVCHSFRCLVSQTFLIAQCDQFRLVLGDRAFTQELVVLFLKLVTLLFLF